MIFDLCAPGKAILLAKSKIDFEIAQVWRWGRRPNEIALALLVGDLSLLKVVLIIAKNTTSLSPSTTLRFSLFTLRSSLKRFAFAHPQFFTERVCVPSLEGFAFPSLLLKCFAFISLHSSLFTLTFFGYFLIFLTNYLVQRRYL